MAFAFSPITVNEAVDFEHAVVQIPEAALRDADAIVLRIAAPLWLQIFMGDPGQSQMLAAAEAAVGVRAPGLDVYAFQDGHSCATSRPAYAARHRPILLFSGRDRRIAQASVDDQVLADIRTQDLTACIGPLRSRCVISAGDNYHFELPSGAHASQFLRLAEAFVSLEAVDRIAYWVALDIERQTEALATGSRNVLFVDHPSMLLLAARVQLLVSVPCDVQTVPGYPSDADARTALFRLLDRAESSHRKVFVLVGVASTGRLANTVQQWAAQRPRPNVTASVLFAVRDLPDVATFCQLQLPSYSHFADAAGCELCNSGRNLVKIQGSNFLIGSNAPETSVPLLPSYFADQRPFIEKWGKHAGVLRVHYDDPNPTTGRHHAFYIDVDSLLAIPDFFDEVVRRVRSFEPAPELILVPSHASAVRLGQRVSELLALPLAVLDAETLARPHMDAVPELSRVGSVVVLDDLMVTGAALDRINRYLRELSGVRRLPLRMLRFFTPLATPCSASAYQARLRGLVSNHGWTSTVEHLHTLVLPDWHEKGKCPWCVESMNLTELAQAAGDLDGPLAQRLVELIDTRNGLADSPLFVVPPAAALPDLGDHSAALERGSTALQVIFACASALQQLRHADRQALKSHDFPSPSFLAARVFSTNYSERLLWLGLLRTVKQDELDSAARRLLAQAALDVNDLQRVLLHGEVAIAWLLGKLGPIPSSEPVQTFFEHAGISWQSMISVGLVARR